MRHLEDRLQIACVNWFEWQYRKLADLLHHSPNGGFRNPAEASKFKDMGVRPGFPDLFLAVPSGGYHGLFIELKSEKGRQTQAQALYENLLKAQGYSYVLIRSLDEFQNTVNNYLK